MKYPMLFVAALTMAVSTVAIERAEAVVYCQYVGVPQGCVARPGVVLARAPGIGAPGVGIRPGTVGNRGGPVNRVGRR